MDTLPFIRRPFRFQHYNAAMAIIIVNAGLFLVSYLLPSLRLVGYLAMNPALVVMRNWWWQVFTHMFMHADIWHLVFNMLAVFFFGIQLERRIGSSEFLLFYLLSGTLAGLFSLLVYWSTGAYMVYLLGASGAVFAVLLAFATYFPASVILLFGVFPIRAPILVLGYAAIEVFNMIGRTRGNVAHLTHLAGFAFAYLYLVIRLRINPITEFFGDRRY